MLFEKLLWHLSIASWASGLVDKLSLIGDSATSPTIESDWTNDWQHGEILVVAVVAMSKTRARRATFIYYFSESPRLIKHRGRYYLRM